MMLLCGLLIVLSLYFCWILFTPLNKIRTVEDVDFTSGNNDRHNLVNEVRRRKKIGNIPPIYPNGWFALIESQQIHIGKTKSVYALGETFAVFRDESGRVYVLDAWCPHLGANLGVGGIVQEDCLECPFHGWRFSGQTGNCTRIPYESKVPSTAKVKPWHVRECNGFVFVWYHAENELPQWELPELPEINSGKWVCRGRTEHYINAHIQEIPENGADTAHLSQVHLPIIVGGSDLSTMWRFRVLGHHTWGATWSSSEDDKHTATLNLQHDIVLFNSFKLKPLHLSIVGKQIGPGVVYLHSDTWLGKAVFIQTVTPLDGLTQRVIHRLYTERKVLQPFASIILVAQQWHFERDIMIWNHKMYLKTPLLVPEDQQIKRFRKWYKQFYSTNSPQLTFQKNSQAW